MNILDFKSRKEQGRAISMLTCYDHWTARILESSAVDCLLVGDSLAMVIHGYESTVHATLDMMVLHTRAVARGTKTKFIVADMPFLTFRKGPVAALEAAGALIQAGAHAVKLEGVSGHEECVSLLVESGIPVMGHLGLTPQSIHQLGGFRVQGRLEAQALKLRADALLLEKLGCFSLVLECVPEKLARETTSALGIPTIGIGAGVGTDGQVLVLQDLLGASPDFNPKFLKKYAALHDIIANAANSFDDEVKEKVFPTLKESYV